MAACGCGASDGALALRVYETLGLSRILKPDIHRRQCAQCKLWRDRPRSHPILGVERKPWEMRRAQPERGEEPCVSLACRAAMLLHLEERLHDRRRCIPPIWTAVDEDFIVEDLLMPSLPLARSLQVHAKICWPPRSCGTAVANAAVAGELPPARLCVCVCV